MEKFIGTFKDANAEQVRVYQRRNGVYDAQWPNGERATFATLPKDFVAV